MFKRFPNAMSIECNMVDLSNIFPFISSFTNLHRITVSNDSALKIENSFDIHTVIIQYCEVISIHGLGKNRLVELVCCRGDVVDVSSLATVPLVTILKCQFKKVNYESLRNVPRLKIVDCKSNNESID
mmetsp:Transcript_12494/g.13467  ORF Transcript_12494/g.13467 Transcript_12494/m.13467 type:complete len:128 (+) Transcript_12494:2-385(+)